MRLFVTGVGGFVGAAVVHAALLAGHEVFGTIRPGGNLARVRAIGSGFQALELDMRDREAVISALAAIRPEVLIHSAWGGVTSQSRGGLSQVTNNIDAACHLLIAGAAVGLKKFVGIGSQSEYGLLAGRVDERHLPEPTSLYGAAKLSVLHLTQQLSAQAGTSFAWLRLFATYGPGDNPNWLIPSLINQMLAGVRPRTTEAIQLWDYLYIDDVATGILAVATHSGAAGVFNLGSGQPIAVRMIVERIRDRVAPGLDLVFGEVPYSPSQIWHMEADVSRLKNATGWAPAVDLSSGLDRTVAWYRKQRLLAADG
ncbi:MAG: NAD-dependent epimerase/dehydratase family protein [Acidiphilium sp.]